MAFTSPTITPESLLALLGGGSMPDYPTSGLQGPVPMSGLPLGEQGMGMSGGGASMAGGGMGGQPGFDQMGLLDLLRAAMAQQEQGGGGQGLGVPLGQSGGIGGGGGGGGFGAGGELAPGIAPGMQGPQTTGDLLGLLKTAAGLGKEALDAQNFLTKMFGGEAPSGSFARSPEVESAYQAYRGGERADMGPLAGGAGGAGAFALSPEIVSGASGGAAAPAGFNAATAAPFQISPDILSGVSGGAAVGGAGAVPAGVASGLDIAYGGTGGAVAAAGGAAGSLAGALPLLAFVAPALSMAGGALSGEPEHSWQQRYPTGAEAGLVPFIGPVLGPLMGALGKTGLFGQHRSQSQALKAEMLEAGRSGDIGRGGINTTAQATTFPEFFDLLRGVVGMGESGIGVGGEAGNPFQTPTAFIQNVLSNPASLGVDVAAGVRPSLLWPSREAMTMSLLQTINRLGGRPGAMDELTGVERMVPQWQEAIRRSQEAEKARLAEQPWPFAPSFG